MSEIGAMRVKGVDYALKDAAAREALGAVSASVDAVGGKCDRIIECVSGGVDDVLDSLNGEIAVGTLLSKAQKALASKAALRAKFGELLDWTDFGVPAKLADWTVLPDRLVGAYAAGCIPRFEDDWTAVVREYAFYGHDIWYVNAPSVAWVADKAFANCRQLTEVHLTGVTALSANAFEGCESLVTAEFGPGLEEIGLKTFAGLTSLESVEGLGNVCYVAGSSKRGEGAFYGCSSLKYLDFSTKLDTVADYMCCGCSSLLYPGDMSGLLCIGTHAFENCNDLSAGFERLPECREIYYCAFAGCRNLECDGGCLKLPKLEMLDGWVFNGCDLISELWLYDCTDIAEDALEGSSVKEIHFRGTYQMRSRIEAKPGYANRWGAGSDVTVKFDA